MIDTSAQAVDILRSTIDGDVDHAVADGKSRFVVDFPFMLRGVRVAKADVIHAIEGERFQVTDSAVSDDGTRYRFDALHADTETFIVERIGMTGQHRVVIMRMFSGSIVEFDSNVPCDRQHLALTSHGDQVTTTAIHGAGGITGFRNRTIEKRMPEA